MAKKYLSIEEAAERIGIDPDELKKLRERGDIRAFADRGTWKFREDDVDELGRKRQADSDPEVPIMRPPVPKKKDDLAGTIMFDDDVSSEGSSIDLGNEIDKSVGEQPTIVRKNRDDLAASDSDVRLVFDDSLLPDEETDLNPLSDLEQSDSDVRLIPGTGFDEGSDSDVKLVSDSTSVKSTGGTGSDSDVKLVNQDDSFSLDMDESDGSFILGGESSGIALSGYGTQNDSGITLEGPNDSGIALESDDSGISLEPNDSGISLDTGDSGISLDTDDSGLVLAGDSGISLLGPSDSGIALEGLSGGPKKKDKGKKGKIDLGGTMPEIPMMAAPDDDMGATQMEVPMLSGDGDSEFEFTASPLDEDSSASVVMLGDDDAPSGKAGKKGGKKKQDSEFDTAQTTEFGSSDMLDSTDAFDSSDAFADVEEADDMEVSDDVIGEDDEITEDVFGAGDEDFDEELTSGSSSAEFAAPVAASRIAMPIQAEWGGGTFFMLFLSSTVMLITSFLMYDVVRTMWGNNEPTAGTEMILSSFRGMFG